MSYDTGKVTTISNLKQLAFQVKSGLDEIEQKQNVLGARIDAQVTASTDADADYAAEVVDARVDAWGNEQTSLGTNIREGQKRLLEAIDELQTKNTEEIQTLAETQLTSAMTSFETNEIRKQEIEREESIRYSEDIGILKQVNILAKTIMKLAIQMNELQETIRSGGN